MIAKMAAPANSMASAAECILGNRMTVEMTSEVVVSILGVALAQSSDTTRVIRGVKLTEIDGTAPSPQTAKFPIKLRASVASTV